MFDQSRKSFTNFFVIITFFIAVSITAFIFLLYNQSFLTPYNPKTDRQEIINLFEKERYWLTATPGYSVEHMLDAKSPSEQQPSFKGALHLFTARINGVFAGFCAYYFKRKDLGQILFIAIDPIFRGKGYAKKMVQFCLNEIKKKGTPYAMILTRVDNIAAQKAYEGVGFIESYRDESFVYYFYDLMQKL